MSRTFTLVMSKVVGGIKQPDTGRTVQIKDLGGNLISAATETPIGLGRYVATFPEVSSFGVWYIDGLAQTGYNDNSPFWCGVYDSISGANGYFSNSVTSSTVSAGILLAGNLQTSTASLQSSINTLNTVQGNYAVLTAGSNVFSGSISAGMTVSAGTINAGGTIQLTTTAQQGVMISISSTGAYQSLLGLTNPIVAGATPEYYFRIDGSGPAGGRPPLILEQNGFGAQLAINRNTMAIAKSTSAFPGMTLDVAGTITAQAYAGLPASASGGIPYVGATAGVNLTSQSLTGATLSAITVKTSGNVQVGSYIADEVGTLTIDPDFGGGGSGPVRILKSLSAGSITSIGSISAFGGVSGGSASFTTVKALGNVTSGLAMSAAGFNSTMPISANLVSNQGGLVLNSGDTNVAGNNVTQVRFGFNNQSPSGAYPSWIATSHNAGASAGNNFRFYTGNGSVTGTYPNDAVLGLTVEAGGIKVPTSAVIGSTLVVNGSMSAAGLSTSLGNTTISGVVNSYSGLTPQGTGLGQFGVPFIVYAGATANINTFGTFVVPNTSAGVLFRVTMGITDATNGAGTLSACFMWSDPRANHATSSDTVAMSTGSFLYLNKTFLLANNGTPLRFSLQNNGSGGTVDVYWTVERLA